MFKAFCSDISSYDEASLAYKKIKLDNIYASHIMMACVFKNGSNLEVFSCDDGEDGGGLTIQKMMLDSQFYGHALFIIRWKLGGNIGARRFCCIEAVVQKVIKKVKMKGELWPCPLLPSDCVPGTQENNQKDAVATTPNPDGATPLMEAEKQDNQ